MEDLLKEIIELTGYVKELEAEDTEEARARIENIDELISKTVTYQQTMEEQDQPATLAAVSYTHLDVYKRQGRNADVPWVVQRGSSGKNIAYQI